MDETGLYGAAQNLLRGTMLETLAAKLHPSHTALIVIDVQNDFCAGEGMMAQEGFDVSAVQAMAAGLPALLAQARSSGVLVVFVRNAYNATPNLYLSDVWLEQAARTRAGSYVTRPVCVADSWGADFFGDVRPLATEAIVTKHRYSAFHNTDLETILRANAIRTTVFVGCATNVCVETSAREAFLRDFYVVVSADGTAGYTRENHEAALRTIDLYFGEVAPNTAIAERWIPAGASLSDASQTDASHSGVEQAAAMEPAEERAGQRFYTSSNGDSWDLARDAEGRLSVIHQPNAPSGGLARRMGLGEFLSVDRHSPECAALLQLLG